ncbi:MAG: hypothetical protein AAFO99_10290 [Bacteroidota bacterium]
MKIAVHLSHVQPRIILILGIILLTSCGDVRPKIVLSATVPEIAKKREAKILTAFFGLDNGLNQRSRLLYANAPGKDGMPMVFSHEIDPITLEGSDFEVTTRNGSIYQVEAATLLPANEEFELRTVLLIGEYGNYPDNPPISIKIVGDLLSRIGPSSNGITFLLSPLKLCPILSYAEYFSFTEEYPYVEKGRGCDCPRASTKMVVRTVWAGGVRAVNGDELGDNELNDFEVTMVKGTDTLLLKPYQLADLDDNDNNIDLCLRESGIPIQVRVNKNIAIDPRGDKNPETRVEIKSRW